MDSCFLVSGLSPEQANILELTSHNDFISVSTSKVKVAAKETFSSNPKKGGLVSRMKKLFC